MAKGNKRNIKALCNTSPTSVLGFCLHSLQQIGLSSNKVCDGRGRRKGGVRNGRVTAVSEKKSSPVSLETRGWNVKSISPGRMLRWLDAAKKGAPEAAGRSGCLTAAVFHCIWLWIWQLCQAGVVPLAGEQPVPTQVSQHVPFSRSFGERTSSHPCPMAQPKRCSFSQA